MATSRSSNRTGPIHVQIRMADNFGGRSGGLGAAPECGVYAGQNDDGAGPRRGIPAGRIRTSRKLLAQREVKRFFRNIIAAPRQSCVCRSASSCVVSRGYPQGDGLAAEPRNGNVKTELNANWRILSSSVPFWRIDDEEGCYNFGFGRRPRGDLALGSQLGRGSRTPASLP